MEKRVDDDTGPCQYALAWPTYIGPYQSHSNWFNDRNLHCINGDMMSPPYRPDPQTPYYRTHPASLVVYDDHKWLHGKGVTTGKWYPLTREMVTDIYVTRRW